MIKTKNNHISFISMHTICMDGQCLKNCLQVVLNGKKNIHKFDEDFTTNCDEYSNKGCDLEVDFECPKILLNLHSDLPFLSERIKI